MRVALVILAIVLLLLATIAILARRRSRRPATVDAGGGLATTAGRSTSATRDADRASAASGSTSAGTAARAATDALARIANEVGRERGLQLAQIARRFLTDAYGVPAMTSSSSELAELLRRREVPIARWEALLDALDAMRIGGPTAIDDLEAHLRAALA